MTARLALLAGAALSVAGLVASSASAALDTYSSPTAYTAAVGLEKFALDFNGSTGAAVPGNAFSAKVKFGSPEAPPADRGLVFWNSDAITDMGSTTAANGVGPIEGVFSDPPCAFAFDYASGKLGTVELYGVDDALIGTVPGAAAGFFGVVSPTVPIRRFVISGNLFAPDARDRIFVDNFRVNECITNTPPSIELAGVVDGASYEFGTVVGSTCFVTDAEDGPTRFSATHSQPSGPLASLGLGTATASCSYTDSGGLTATAQATYTIVDTTPPGVGGLPEVLLATGPTGAVLVSDYLSGVSASDEVDGINLAVICSPPVGTLLPIGPFTLTCSATDSSGNTGSRTVTGSVWGAPEQLESLRGSVERSDGEPGVRTSLLAKLRNGSCGALAAFVNEVRAQAGRGVRLGNVASFTGAAENIRQVLACR